MEFLNDTCKKIWKNISINVQIFPYLKLQTVYLGLHQVQLFLFSEDLQIKDFIAANYSQMTI